MPSILLLGAGELGLSPHRDTSTLTVLLRPSTHPTHPLFHNRDLNISTLPANLADSPVSDLAPLFAPYDIVIGCTGMLGPPGLQRKICDAVLQAGVKRYFPWQFGVDYDVIGRGSAQDLFSEQVGVREALRAQDKTRWVVVSTGIFMGFLFEEAFGVVGEKEGGKKVVRALGGKDNRVTVTAVEDIGRVVAELVYSAPETQGVVFTAGQTVSYEQLARTIGEVLEKEVEVDEWELDQLRKELEQDPGNGLKKYRVVFAEGRGVWWDEEKSWNKQQRLELKDVKQWMEQNLDVRT